MVIGTTFKRKKKEQGGVRPTGEEFKRLGGVQPLKGELDKKRIAKEEHPEPSRPEGSTLKVKVSGGQISSGQEVSSLAQQQRIANLEQGGFAKSATELPLVGTTIKTIGRGFAEIAGAGEQFEKELGPTSGLDIAETALTIGTIAMGAGIGVKLLKGAGVKATAVSSKGAGTARITQMKSAHKLNPLTGGLDPRGTIQTQRAFVGRPAATGVDKLFKIKPRSAAIAGRFATNTKSQTATASMLQKIGLTSKGAGFILGTLGTYPFAGFIKEEALQASSFAFQTAFFNNDVKGMEDAINKTEETLDNNFIESLVSFIPIANIVEETLNYFEASRIQVENQKRVLENLR